MVNLFCYKLEQDITESSKANMDNKNCVDCIYLKVCESDLREKNEVKVVKEELNLEKEVKVEKHEKVEKVKKQEVKQTVKKEKVKKKESKKKSTKPTLEEIAALEDIF